MRKVVYFGVGVLSAWLLLGMIVLIAFGDGFETSKKAVSRWVSSTWSNEEIGGQHLLKSNSLVTVTLS